MRWNGRAARFVFLACVILKNASLGADSPLSKSDFNHTHAPAGWLIMPSKELVLEIQGGVLTKECRKEAGEFTFFVLRELTRAGYSIYLPESFVEDEIRYYQLNSPAKDGEAIHQGILACLQTAKRSGAFDWDCFKAVYKYADPLSSGVYLPWSQPPPNPSSLQLVGIEARPLPHLILSTQWTARTTTGFVSTQSGYEPATTVSGQATLCSPAYSLRLVVGEKTEFSRYYAREPWRNHYSSPDLPEHKLTAAVLQDIRIGLEAPAKAENPKPENPTKTKKQSKPSAKYRLQSP